MDCAHRPTHKPAQIGQALKQGFRVMQNTKHFVCGEWGVQKVPSLTHSWHILGVTQWVIESLHLSCGWEKYRNSSETNMNHKRKQTWRTQTADKASSFHFTSLYFTSDRLVTVVMWKCFLQSYVNNTMLLSCRQIQFAELMLWTSSSLCYTFYYSSSSLTEFTGLWTVLVQCFVRKASMVLI